MHWKDFFYFSTAEKIAVLFLIFIIILSFGLNVLLSRKGKTPIAIPENDSLIVAFERLHETLENKKTTKKNYYLNSEKRVSVNDEKHNSAKNKKMNTSSEDSQYVKTEKLSVHQTISLNETDTAEWQKVPGIGSTYAARIVKYRNLLGGYVSVNQLKEVYGIPEDLINNIAPYIREEHDSTLQKVNVNVLEFKQILAHPYISYEQTKAIVNLRKRVGKIASISQLAMLDEFLPEDIKRLTPYLEF